MTNLSLPDNMTNIPNSPTKWSGWGGRFFLLALLFWVIAVTYGTQTITWLSTMTFNDNVGGAWVKAALIQVGLTAVPLLPFAFWWPNGRYRSIFQTWLVATLAPLLLAPTRFFQPTQSQAVLLSQSLLLLVLAGGLWALYRRQIAAFFRPAVGAVALAAALAVLINLPFLAWGSLGSLLDTLLTLVVGLLFGVVVGLVNGRYWLYEFKQSSQGTGWNMLTGGLVVGATLLIMSSGLSFNGVQLALMIALPALGWVAMGIAVTNRPASQNTDNSLALGLLIGLSTALILLFTDSDGMFLGAMDGILRWVMTAAFVTIPVALLIGFLLLLFRKRLTRAENTSPEQGRSGRFLIIFALLAWAIGVGVYLLAGQPGFYGDRLFVILNDQADVSSATDMDDYDARRQFVYDTLTQHATTSQADLRASLDKFGTDYTPYYLTNAIEVRGGLLLRLWLSTRPEVDRILASPILRPVPENLTIPSEAAVGPSQPEWNLTNIGADRVWRELGVTGAGIIVGQSDSGADANHPELADSYRGVLDNNGNWFDPWNATTAPVDNGGHGTHTLGSILGNTVGVAPDAEWFACTNLDRNLGNPALYLDCMQFMLAPFPQNGDPFVDGNPLQSAHVLNNSWGCPEEYEGCDADSLRTAVRALRDAGIFIVVSAGNEGPACGSITSPLAIYDEVFSVGAVDENNNLAKFSSVGPVTVDGSGRIKPDIAAPGVDVLSSLPGGSYGLNSGTSMAGPHVVGVVALLWSANPALIGDIERTEEILRASATPYTPVANPPTMPAGLEGVDADLPSFLTEALDQTASLVSGTCLAETDTSVVPNNIVGYGIVNAYEAVKMALDG